tara:strand:+ start:8712 stop:9719 length:1008 start_codon:yes stop_codon:yes gene_type:complete
MEIAESLRVECTVHSFVFEKNGKSEEVSFALVKLSNDRFYVVSETVLRRLARGDGKYNLTNFLDNHACGVFYIDGRKETTSSGTKEFLVVDSILYKKNADDRFCYNFFSYDWAGKRVSAFLIVAFHVAKTMQLHGLELTDAAVIQRDQSNELTTRATEVKFSARATLLGQPAFYERWGFQYAKQKPEVEATRKELQKQYLLKEGEAAAALEQIRASENAWLWGKLSRERLAQLRAQVTRLEGEKAALCYEWFKKANWEATLAISGKEYKDWKQACVNKGAWMPSRYSSERVEEFAAAEFNRFGIVHRAMQPSLKRRREESVGHSCGLPSLHLLEL